MNPHADSVQQPSDESIRNAITALWNAQCFTIDEMSAFESALRFGTRPAAEPIQSGSAGEAEALLTKIDTLIASVNEAHHAKSEGWKQGCFDAADRVYEEIKGMVAALASRSPAAQGEAVGYVNRKQWPPKDRAFAASVQRVFADDVPVYAAPTPHPAWCSCGACNPEDAEPAPTPEAEPAQQDTKPAFWVLTEQLRKRETTHLGYMWFVDPKNSAWTPVYTAAPPAEKQAAPSGEALLLMMRAQAERMPDMTQAEALRLIDMALQDVKGAAS